MTSISSATLGGMVGNTQSSAKQASETYQQFLLLLTTQLQNQDPLDPMQSNEFTNQLVQFSQVEQGILTNEKLDALLQQWSDNQIGQSLAYIGKDVYYRGDTIFYEGEEMKIGYAIDGDAAMAKLNVIDEDGNPVRSLDIPAGTTSGSIAWDGLDNDGMPVDKNKIYKVRVDALTANKDPIQDTYTGVPARITGVETINGLLFLSLNGDRRIEAASALSISIPEEPKATNHNPNNGSGSGGSPDEGEVEPDESA